MEKSNYPTPLLRLFMFTTVFSRQWCNQFCQKTYVADVLANDASSQATDIGCSIPDVVAPNPLLFRFLVVPLKNYGVSQVFSIGYENHSKRAWVKRVMMQTDQKEISIAISLQAQTKTSSIIASNVYGDRSSTIVTITLASYFLVAFASFIQSARYFVHSTFLISTRNTEVPVVYMQQDVVRRSNFWSLGLGALYFVVTLLLWIFGPIPMFASSVIMVSVLYVLDANSCPMHEYQFPKLKLTEGNESKTPSFGIDEYGGDKKAILTVSVQQYCMWMTRKRSKPVPEKWEH
ncbi:hypothetical protein IFM89_010843 [Coptis chinensis]|uniref:Uncharacterized protein n=1 Tax=Coptis chinensis TaxID=261450 RepID=A0A835M2V5_9MAGN|nr:hypothetical protein IFM89_010843 [Coptis chinensis]